MTPKEKVKKLKIYLEKCENDHKSATNQHKKDFFKREIEKTSKTIEKLL